MAYLEVFSEKKRKEKCLRCPGEKNQAFLIIYFDLQKTE